MTVEELLGRMSSAEFTEWQAYFKLVDNPQLAQALFKKQTPEQMKHLLMGVASKKSKKRKKK